MMTEKIRNVAVLDESGKLIGSKKTTDGTGIEHGDLPTDGQYKWDSERNAFIPLGHGFGKVKEGSPYSIDFVLARIIETAPAGTIPVEATQWLLWYNRNIRQREEELAARGRG